MWDTVVVGSGPGGSSAAIAAAKRGKRVLILERGSQMQGRAGRQTLGGTISGLMRMKNNAPNVAGGGSAINYGVLATPTLDDITRGLGNEAAQRTLPKFKAYLEDIGRPQASRPVVSPLLSDVTLALKSFWSLSESTDVALKESTSQPGRTNEETVLRKMIIKENKYYQGLIDLL